MSDINKALGNFGAPLPLHVGDRVYQLAWADQVILAEFCSWLKSTARQAVLLSQSDLPEKLFLKMLQKVNRDIAPPLSLYEPFGEVFQAELRDVQSDGWAYLLFLLLRRHTKTMTAADGTAHPFTLDDAKDIAAESYAADPGTDDEPGELARCVRTVLSAATDDHLKKNPRLKRLTAANP